MALICVIMYVIYIFPILQGVHICCHKNFYSCLSNTVQAIEQENEQRRRLEAASRAAALNQQKQQQQEEERQQVARNNKINVRKQQVSQISVLLQCFSKLVLTLV